jgi:hypothetical protein
MRGAQVGLWLGILISISGAITVMSQPRLAAPALDPAQLLTADDVMRLSGIKDLRVLPRDLKEGAVADITFIQPDGQFVAALTVQKAGQFDRWAKFHRKSLIKLEGLGESSFARATAPEVSGPSTGRPPGESPREIAALYVKQNGLAFSVTAFASPGGKLTLSLDQLKALTRVVTDRVSEHQARIEAGTGTKDPPGQAQSAASVLPLPQCS